MTRRLGPWLTLGLLLLVFGVLLLWPIYQVLRVGFFGFADDVGGSRFTLGYVRAVFEDQMLRRGLVNSGVIAMTVTLACLLISVPLAMLSVRFDFWGKAFFTGLALVPLALPPFVGAIGMRQILGRFGMLTGLGQALGLVAPGDPVDWLGARPLLGVVLIEALNLYPVLFLNASAALANVDPSMEQAARNLGASRWRVFSRITLPLMRPGLFAGGTIVLIWSFTELGTPLMLGYYEATPVQIFHRINQVSGSPVPYALVVITLVSSTLLYLVGKLVLGRQDVAVTKASVQSAARALSFARSVPVILPFVAVSGFALLPHLGVLLTSVSGIGAWYGSVWPSVVTAQHYATALTHDLALPSVANSIAFASATVALDLVFGLAIAYVIVRTTLPGRALVDGLAMLPLAVPGLVLAFGYLAVSVQLATIFRETKWLRDLVDVQENPAPLLVVAYAMRRLPYVVRSAVAGLEQTPLDLELAARNLGAPRGLTLRRITIPLIAANLAAGALFAFALAMLEVSDSLILAQRQASWPITKAIYELSQRLGDGPYIASALGAWAMVLLALAILAATTLIGRKLGALFRV